MDKSDAKRLLQHMVTSLDTCLEAVEKVIKEGDFEEAASDLLFDAEDYLDSAQKEIKAFLEAV